MLTRLPEDLLSERVLPLLDTRELILCAAAAHKILPAFAPELHAAFLRRDWKAAGARALRIGRRQLASAVSLADADRLVRLFVGSVFFGGPKILFRTCVRQITILCSCHRRTMNSKRKTIGTARRAI